MSTSTEDRATGKDFETHRCGLFVSLERWIDGTLELAQEIETTESSEQAYRNFQRHVNRLCFLIVASECSDREIDIERRVQVATLFPEKMPLYDVVLREPFPSASAAVP